ncbi:oxidoreductase [Rathayibacter sp. Leaf299]|uniref:Gfo/Idh/MocA family protein n=1 Tax=Rathayibacter sp. Leaf299 TaxID=1736328 RepID=UPI0007013854|nr:Gfo/Idh/MocA family oxidoreductase [Rathayibacter sp. Leaf299]KQQ20736.1 oxidoreductase [Rathayibacter sp. Leaf299]
MTAAQGSGPVGVGIIGAGVISDAYLENLGRFADVRVVFIADLEKDRARAQAEKHGIAGHGSVEQLLGIDEIEIVVNLTVPAVHAGVGLRCVAAGKHVWSEKPLALDHDSGTRLLADADAAGVQVACAPDTVLGAGLQTALRAIARGDIGEPLTATTLFHVPGPESWHPSPEFLFAEGAGPLFDMGPYYLTTLVHVFGAAHQVSAVASRSSASRTIGSGPRAGQMFPVVVPTHHAALISFESGHSAQSVFSFQNALPRMGFVEISGSEGTLVLPDPNTFDGDSTLWRFGSQEPTVLPAVGPAFGRGAGVVDLARVVRRGGVPRANGAIANHVLDIMLGISRAAEEQQVVEITSSVARPHPLPEDWDPAAATL